MLGEDRARLGTAGCRAERLMARQIDGAGQRQPMIGRQMGGDVGAGVGAGVGCGVGTGVGAAVAAGVWVGTGSGVGGGTGLSVGTGVTVGLGVGAGVAVESGCSVGVESAPCGVGVGAVPAVAWRPAMTNPGPAEMAGLLRDRRQVHRLRRVHLPRPVRPVRRWAPAILPARPSRSDR